MEEDIKYKIILRHDISTNWTTNNPVLANGEYGIEDDTHRVKRGDGSTAWIDLSYETFGIIEMYFNFENISGDVDDNAKLKAKFDTEENDIANIKADIVEINAKLVDLQEQIDTLKTENTSNEE